MEAQIATEHLRENGQPLSRQSSIFGICVRFWPWRSSGPSPAPV
ncbi:hypothetical protein [Nocardia lijiangensis]